MRGREPCVDVRLDFCGITPAYAGKSESYGLPALPRWDHPRVCGEELFPAGFEVAFQGSPPRMRGRENSEGVTRNGSRITPAYAGKSGMAAAQRLLNQDHPRVCGEESGPMPYLLCSSGSPPRMRGRAPQRTLNHRQGGITPAYAGKSHRRSPSWKAA